MDGAFEPRRGPFRVASIHVAKVMALAVSLFLLMGGIGAGLIGGGLSTGGDLLETSRLWQEGTEAPQAALQGEVDTEGFLFKEYSLQLQYQTTAGEVHTADVDFSRWFYGPDQGDSYTVRYLASEPTKATISWAAEATVHGWVVALLIILLGAAGLFAGVELLRMGLRRVLLAKRLARSGRLVAVHFT